MIGVYDYTVVLTYLSLLSAGTGIVVSLGGRGHPFLGIFFLLICGLCDAFDGKVASTKKNRSDLERKFRPYCLWCFTCLYRRRFYTHFGISE